MFTKRIEAALDERASANLSRRLRPVKTTGAAQLQYAGQEMINFSSNDYLGLAQDFELAKAWQQGIERYGCGSGASPMVTGFSSAHQKLEEELCDWQGYDRAILFSSGFSANQALLFTLLKKGDYLLQDKLNHASLMEAGSLSLATMKRFKHNDVAHLSALLPNGKPSLVVTEGVFSMDGDQASLTEIASVLPSHSWLAVDDAHGVGVLGQQGHGSCHAQGVKPELLVVTFGKAFGLSGAAILCNAQAGDFFTQFARHHVYSTAMPPSQAHALSHALKMIQQQEWRRDKLLELQSAYHDTLRDVSGYVRTNTPIKPFLLGSAEKAIELETSLREQGFWASAIRPPTVPVGQARLRITLTASHTIEQVIAMGSVIRRVMEANYDVR